MNSTVPRPTSLPAKFPVDSSLGAYPPAMPNSADAVRMLLQRVGDGLQDVGDVGAKAPETKAVAAALNAQIDVYNFLTSTAEGAAMSSLAAVRGSLMAELTQLDSMGLTPEERDARRTQAYDRTIGLARDRATAKVKATANTLAASALSKMNDAIAAVDVAVAKATGPIALSTRLDINDAVASNALREELRPLRPQRWLAIWRGFAERGQAREELLTAMVVQTLAAEIITSPPAKLATRYGAGAATIRASEIGIIRGEAQQCLAALEARQKSLVPPHLAVLQRALAWMAVTFEFLLGPALVWLASRELDARTRQGVAPLVQVVPTWLSRFVDVVLRSQVAK